MSNFINALRDPKVRDDKDYWSCTENVHDSYVDMRNQRRDAADFIEMVGNALATGNFDEVKRRYDRLNSEYSNV